MKKLMLMLLVVGSLFGVDKNLEGRDPNVVHKVEEVRYVIMQNGDVYPRPSKPEELDRIDIMIITGWYMKNQDRIFDMNSK